MRLVLAALAVIVMCELALLGILRYKSAERAEIRSIAVTIAADRSEIRRSESQTAAAGGATVGQGGSPAAEGAPQRRSRSAPLTVNVQTSRPATPEEMALAALRNSKQQSDYKVTQDRQAIYTTYSRLLAGLELAQPDLERLLQLLVDKKRVPEDLNAALSSRMGRSGAGDRQFVKNALAAANNEVQKDIEVLLGKDGYAQYLQYEANLPEQALVIQLQQALGNAGLHLEAGQADGIYAVLVSARSSPVEPQVALVPVSKQTQVPISAGGFNFATLSPRAVFVDAMGWINVNLPLSANAKEGVVKYLNLEQRKVLDDLLRKQSAEREMGRRFGFGAL